MLITPIAEKTSYLEEITGFCDPDIFARDWNWLKLLLDNRLQWLLRDAETVSIWLFDKHPEDAILIEAESQVKLLSCLAICLAAKIHLSLDFTLGTLRYIINSWLVDGVKCIRLFSKILIQHKLVIAVAEWLITASWLRHWCRVIQKFETSYLLSNSLMWEIRHSKQCANNLKGKHLSTLLEAKNYYKMRAI